MRAVARGQAADLDQHAHPAHSKHLFPMFMTLQSEFEALLARKRKGMSFEEVKEAERRAEAWLQARPEPNLADFPFK